VDEDIEYSGKQLDKDIVNKSQIRTIIKAVKENLPNMFPDRFYQTDKNKPLQTVKEESDLQGAAPSPLERAGVRLGLLKYPKHSSSPKPTAMQKILLILYGKSLAKKTSSAKR